MAGSNRVRSAGGVCHLVALRGADVCRLRTSEAVGGSGRVVRGGLDNNINGNGNEGRSGRVWAAVASPCGMAEWGLGEEKLRGERGRSARFKVFAGTLVRRPGNICPCKRVECRVNLDGLVWNFNPGWQSGG